MKSKCEHVRASGLLRTANAETTVRRKRCHGMHGPFCTVLCAWRVPDAHTNARTHTHTHCSLTHTHTHTRDLAE